jgi:hypothetical protein
VTRLIPVAAHDDEVFCPLGTAIELPLPLWSELSHSLGKWLGEFEKQYPQGSSEDFFRYNHAKVQRWISEARA